MVLCITRSSKYDVNMILYSTELERLSLRKDLFVKILPFSPSTYNITVKL